MLPVGPLGPDVMFGVWFIEPVGPEGPLGPDVILAEPVAPLGPDGPDVKFGV